MAQGGEIHREDRCGIAYFWAETPPPARAALVFGVGTIHETLATSGITHLVEHLALHQLIAKPELRFNGFVGPNVTVFHVEGRPEQVAHFLELATAGVSSLPLDRIMHERSVLDAEARMNRRDSLGRHLSARYGARGMGLNDFRQLGLLRVTADEVDAWAHTAFARGNAALLSSVRLPDDIDLRLPDGPAIVHPDPDPLVEELPNRYVLNDAPGVGITMIGKRSSALTASMTLLRPRLFESLRHGEGHAYSPGASYLPISATTAHLLVAPDASAENNADVTRLLLEGIARIRSDGPTEAELATYKQHFDDQRLGPYSVLGELNRICFDLVSGRPVDADIPAEVHALTPESVAAALDTAYGAAKVFAGPDAAPTIRPALVGSASSISGGRSVARQATLPDGLPTGTQLTIGAEGVSASHPTSTPRLLTVRYDDLAAVLVSPRGPRVLIGNDGVRLPLRDGEWEGFTELCAEIEAAAGPSRIIQLTEPPAISDPSCVVCRAVPARRLVVREARRGTPAVRRYDMVLCRDCGRYLLRASTANSLGMVRLRRLGAGIVAAFGNIPGFLAVQRLHTPKREVTEKYWHPGRPVFARPVAWALPVMLAILVAVGFIIFAALSAADHPSTVGPDNTVQPNPQINLPSELVTLPPAPT